MQCAKVTHFEECGNMRYPKVRKGYGYGTSILDLNKLNFNLSLNRREAGLRFYAKNSIISDSSSMSCDTITKHRELNKNPSFVNRRLINIIGDSQTLILAYELVKSNVQNGTFCSCAPGKMTKGSTNKTLDGISLKWIRQVSMQIKAGKFKFTHAKTLTIGSLRDKVVQKAIELVLSPIYESIFLENSHGFRPARGCHTAIKDIRKWFHKISWVIESDIGNCFPSVYHTVLLSIIREKVKCDKTVALIRNLLESGYISPKVFCESKMGVPQGSRLSTLLCNIYLHKLDVFMANLRQEFAYTGGKSLQNTRATASCHRLTFSNFSLQNTRATASCHRLTFSNFSRRTNPEYKDLQRRIQKTFDPVERSKLIQKLRKTSSKDPFDPDYLQNETFCSFARRLFYTRYADGFVIGITGSRKEATEILERVNIFLSEELKMNLKESKTRIVHFKKKKQSILFLGTTIYVISRTEKPIRTVKHPRWGKSIKVRVTPRVRFHVPIKSLLDKLLKNKFIKRDKFNVYKPTALGRVVNLDHADILKYYNSVAREIMNFYSFADNYTRIGATVKYHLLHSCALTLTLKYKLRFKTKVFNRFGKTLRCPDTGKEFYIN
uniref:Putative reverse transcriptase n=1 Tax=Oltmannsiellopsis viridis TaxID=51324 RepID=Q0QIN8_OLTVI|nr:putative reverse transcriptase [Oltmannsiellopsis viridis]ABC96366.1 putative reverse transcriptase [Oltmannsiellopsis viridis]